jgi:UDP-N-acetylglucosamine 2-epimerase (non-hydrolysing)
MPRVTVHLVAAARPNFMKIAPLYHALTLAPSFDTRIVHTGQHYDTNMSDAFFQDLRLPTPHFNLDVGSGSHAEQTAGVMVGYERVAVRERPDWIVVVGDVNSTAACAMVGAKLWIPVIHLEAGLRSGDRQMPEEINRLVTDAICDVLWTPSSDADQNLLREGVSPERIDRVGNIMIDSFEMMRSAIQADGTRNALGLDQGQYAVITLHRPSNVDVSEKLEEIVDQLVDVSQRLKLVFAVHPRTRKKLAEFRLTDRLASGRIVLTEPLPYVPFMNLVQSARAVITDSGGVQEESTYLGIPCLTLRGNTERPITITEGTNRLVEACDLHGHIAEVLADQWPTGRRPELWDGRTADRCVAALTRRTQLPRVQ